MTKQILIKLKVSSIKINLIINMTEAETEEDGGG
jgi:hypothetical protein